MSIKPISPVVLTILDGWGYSTNENGNAIKSAYTPTMDKISTYYPQTLLNASGKDVGLPEKQMGNSEVGHATIGAGRIINQDLVRIDQAIQNKNFFKNSVIHKLCEQTCSKQTKLHIIGLCSDGGVHSHISHLKALIELIKIYNMTICLHLITDGRDTAPQNATMFISDIEFIIKNIPQINICTISGRYYSMDRDCRWSRTEKTYQALTKNEISSKQNIVEILQQYYDKGISDEFIPPTRILEGSICNNDSIIFFNFRPDRIRQLLHSLIKPNFKGFTVFNLNNLNIISFTEYDSNIKIPIIFPKPKKNNFLGEIIAQQGLKQFRIAETEKYAHVTYFFNGGVEEPFIGEDRELIPSPKVETYDLDPKMSAQQLTESLIKAIDKNIYHFIVINYANPDMVGHTGNFEATVEAICCVDKCLQQILQKIQEINGTLIVTADHGNAEYMLTSENKICKSHSINLVPFIIINYLKSITLKDQGSLADIAPTILEIMGINIPKDMDGESLLLKKQTITKI
uniref:2,3-bisphosphoglycerate-independent phosphoglycerate mutase n=1 Tax=Crouania attenuata TaxID=42002 RepID=A0A4D6WSQ3_9FLOR|nr:Phosphoglycerate mutase [Crouania attenuata]